MVDASGNTILMHILANERNLDLEEAVVLCGRLIDISPQIIVLGNTLGEAPLDIVLERFKAKNVIRFIDYAKRAKAAGVRFREEATTTSVRRVRTANQNPLQLFLKSIMALPVGTRVQSSIGSEVKLASNDLGLCAEKAFYARMDTLLEERKFGLGGAGSFLAVTLALSELSAAEDESDECQVHFVGDGIEPMPSRHAMQSAVTVQDYLVFMLELQRLSGKAANQYATTAIKKLISSGYLHSGLPTGAIFAKLAASGTDTETLWQSLFAGSAAEAQQRADGVLVAKIKAMARLDEADFSASLDSELDLLTKPFGSQDDGLFNVVLDSINPDDEARLTKLYGVLVAKNYDFARQNKIGQNSIHKFAEWAKQKRRFTAFAQAAGSVAPALLRVPDRSGKQPLDSLDLTDIVGGGLMGVPTISAAILERLGVGASLIASGAWF
jgi:hypothetical protein